MPFNINGWEFVVLVVLFLILFGPDRLPEVAVQIGKLVREVRKASDSATAEITRELEAAARESGTSTKEIREAGETARRLLQDTSRAITAAVTVDPLRQIGESAPAVLGEADPPGDGSAPTGAPDDTGGAAADAAPGEPIDVEMLARKITPFDPDEDAR